MSWYYTTNGEQHGPVSRADLEARLRSGALSRETLVWNERMTDWQPASRVAELALGNPTALAAPAPRPVAFQAPARPIANYLWQSIAVTILCCLPTGIIAIVYAAKVDGLVACGDLAGARAAASTARMWCLVSAISWIVLVGGYLLFMLLLFGGLAGLAG